MSSRQRDIKFAGATLVNDDEVRIFKTKVATFRIRVVEQLLHLLQHSVSYARVVKQRTHFFLRHR